MQHQKAAEDFGRLAYYHSLAMVCYKNLTSTQCRRIVETVDADLLRKEDEE